MLFANEPDGIPLNRIAAEAIADILTLMARCHP